MDVAKKNMSELDHLRLISTNLDKILCGEGFDIFRTIIKTAIPFDEWFKSKYQVTQSNDFKETKIYGSIGEGLYYPINIPCKRDIDIVKIFGNIVAVENATDIIHNHTESLKCLIENDQSLPGYCYLRVIKEGSDICVSNYVIQYMQSSAIQRYAQVILADTPSSLVSLAPDYFGNVEHGQLGQQGPATNCYFNLLVQLFNGFINITKVDIVFVIPCPNWPSAAYEWISRARLYGWPTTKQIREIVDQGIYFAPVGCKNHLLEGFQWRYSFNEAEKRLVQSFNPTQAKCYVLLKRIISENVTIQFKEDVISSYHLKTLMFWTIEETDSVLWIPANLVQCIFLVLKRLVQCADRAYCPSYFMPDENLFISKVTVDNKRHLISTLKCICDEGWPVLARLSNFAMYQNFIDSLYCGYVPEEYETFEMLSSEERWTKIFASMMQKVSSQTFQAAIEVNEIHEIDTIHYMFSRIINNLILETYGCDDVQRKDMLKDYLASVCSSYGTHYISLSRRQIVDRTETAKMEDLGQIYITMSILRNQVECLAKHANYAYMRGNFQSTLSTASSLLRRYFNRPANVLSVYVHADVQVTHLLSTLHDIGTQQGFIPGSKDILENVEFAREVIFLTNEIHAVPENVKVEMFSIDTRKYPKEPNFRFRRCFVIDPYFYVTYLAFLAYCDMGFLEEADQVLQIMEIICSDLPNSHLPSSLNLLADCYVKQRRVEKAIATLSLSMKRNRCRNAALWHVARIVWRFRTYSCKCVIKT